MSAPASSTSARLRASSEPLCSPPLCCTTSPSPSGYARARASPADLAREAPILYLRPFPDRGRPPADTSSAEERELKALLKPYGAFVFAGRWDETAALTGSAILPLPTEGWKHGVSEALPHARLVLIPTTSTGPETLWQLTEALRLLPPSRLLLVLSSGEDGAREYNRFRLAAQKEFARRDRDAGRGRLRAASSASARTGARACWTSTPRPRTAAARRAARERMRVRLRPALGHPPEPAPRKDPSADSSAHCAARSCRNRRCRTSAGRRTPAGPSRRPPRDGPAVRPPP
ncbi:hypothetical protein WJ438_38460 [Streptomyces sp. GD-15H]|uniref:hypothetical protein n=1 Tax=Streptomyces sp. GD-15H TaxID=3129112 RepID=UPI00324F9118